jgi:hypothetical protein
MATSRQRPKPTTRQLHEAERIQARLGHVRTYHDGGAFVVQIYGDDPRARVPHRVISLDNEGKCVANMTPPQYVDPAAEGKGE